MDANQRLFDSSATMPSARGVMMLGISSGVVSALIFGLVASRRCRSRSRGCVSAVERGIYTGKAHRQAAWRPRRTAAYEVTVGPAGSPRAAVAGSHRTAWHGNSTTLASGAIGQTRLLMRCPISAGCPRNSLDGSDRSAQPKSLHRCGALSRPRCRVALPRKATSRTQEKKSPKPERASF